MRETISEVGPRPESRTLLVIYLVLVLALLAVTLDFVIGVFIGVNSSVLGLNLAAGFVIVALLILVYYRMFVSHRIKIEHGEDLW